ncbi:NAD(P)/FAD-dependent oxidoreductase [Aidingimonas lacisalsi]|uniref:NAD(P)/FAD-dependent oxidoreductase n=1 Tax=Aidingimonas lacisalsi TaxID=2604086 RepID=UPI0011D1CAEF|nr:FAD-dependent oxidoreductase [Aidingimonas lacisalsi]
MHNYDFAIVGAGLVGSAIAYGLSSKGYSVAIIDEGDVAFRASRGNFGLVWVQGKGFDKPRYSEWSMRSAELWYGFSEELSNLTGISPHYQSPGGVHLYYDKKEMDSGRKKLDYINKETGGKFDYKTLDRDSLKELIPEVGKSVVGATWSHWDGHANPLLLLKSLHAGLNHYKVKIFTGDKVHAIKQDNGGFSVDGKSGKISAGRVVLAAGLANKDLAKFVGLKAPVSPNRGEILVTEKMRPLLNLPTTFLRQTNEGTVLMGDSHEDVGFDDGTDSSIMSNIASRAVRALPALEDARVVRAWGALRVMTPDGYPIYQESEMCPGAFVVCCHSGVTLAAAHSKLLTEWISGSDKPREIDDFISERFYV